MHVPLYQLFNYWFHDRLIRVTVISILTFFSSDNINSWWNGEFSEWIIRWKCAIRFWISPTKEIIQRTFSFRICLVWMGLSTFFIIFLYCCYSFKYWYVTTKSPSTRSLSDKWTELFHNAQKIVLVLSSNNSGKCLNEICGWHEHLNNVNKL